MNKTKEMLSKLGGWFDGLPVGGKLVVAFVVIFVAVLAFRSAFAQNDWQAEALCGVNGCALQDEFRKQEAIQLQRQAEAREVDRSMRLWRLRECARYNRACADELHGRQGRRANALPGFPSGFGD